MFNITNSCSENLNRECNNGYSLYFPCISSITRGENPCIDFYIVDNANMKEMDLRDVDDITLNISGRFNCNYGSYSYPEHIKSQQFERFSELIYENDFSDIIIHNVILYIDIVDESHELINSYLFDNNIILDIAIEGSIGYFLNGLNEYGILNLTGYDSENYIFLGWNIDEHEGECDLENKYDYLIKNNNIIYNVYEDLIIHAVYQKRREYIIKMDIENYNSSFIVEYMGKKYNICQEQDFVKVLEGHEVKISCIPSDVMPYKFIEWSDFYKNPYRVLKVGGDDLNILLKAYCKLSDIDVTYIDDINANELNNFKTIYPNIIDRLHIDEYYSGNIYIRNCDVDLLNGDPYIKIIENGYIQIIDINCEGNIKLTLNSTCDECKLFLNNYELFPSVVEKNEFVFEFSGEIMTIKGNDCCIFGLKINKEIVHDIGKCTLCLSSEDTLKFNVGDLNIEGGVIVNGNPYGISSVKFAKVTGIAPLIIKNNNIL